MRPHQLALVKRRARQSVLLVAPTGGGKTLAGFLPSLIDLAGSAQTRARPGVLHTLYISPLKALAVDVARNLDAPIAEMGLAVTVETRTGDTPTARRQRQRHTPPDILLTTPDNWRCCWPIRAPPPVRESEDRGAGRTACLVQFQARRSSGAGAGAAFDTGARPSPRRPVGDGGRSRPLQRFLMPQPMDGESAVALVIAARRAPSPQIAISASDSYVPWAGHLARHAMGM